MKDKEDLKNKLFSVVKNFADSDYKGDGDMSCVIWADIQAKKWEKVVPFQSCIYRYMAKNNCDPAAFKYSNSAASQRQSSSSGSSSQTNSNKKSKKQSSVNQTNQTGSDDLSKMNSDQLIDQLKNAEKLGDDAKVYAIEQLLAKNSNKDIAGVSLSRIGARFAKGNGVTQNWGTARGHFEQASSMGDLFATANLCTLHINGFESPVNHRKAFEYCNVAAENGVAEAQANLGWLYRHSNEIPQNEKLSHNWTCKAASQGQPEAVNNAKKEKIKCN